MIEEIKKNIESELAMLREIAINTNKLYFAPQQERERIITAINSLISSMRNLNDSIPSLLNQITLKQPQIYPDKEQQSSSQDFSNEIPASAESYTYPSSIESKPKLIRELGIEESYIKKLKKRRRERKEEYEEFKAARGYLKLSNKIFLNTASSLIQKGYFKHLSKELRKANIDILSHSYIASMLMSSFLALIFGLLITLFLLFFDVSLSPPFINFFEGDYVIRFLRIFWIPFVLPISVFIALYYYPSTEKSALSKGINQELPFAIIHMSAISGSGIQPAEIFRIIGLSREYPHLRKEIRKVLNQINLYGYDLVTALNNAASTTSSIKLAELFSGLATTINSGGSFQEFFDKRANTLLVDYRLERQKHTKSAEAFMDVYISVVIAAPMILMLFLIILTVGNFSVGLSTSQLTFLIISITAAINIIFLIFLHINQPSY